MTKKLKIPKIARSLFYGLALFMYINCSVKEDLIELNKSIIHRKIKFDELKKDNIVMDDLSNYSKIMRQSNLKQKSTDSLVVNFSSANYVETEEFISYTFNMPSSSVPLRNFLLKKQKNSTGGFHGYVLNYNLTQEELNSLNTLELTNLSNKVTSVKIGSNFSPAMFGKSVYCPGIVGICYVGDPDGHVAYGSQCTVSAVQVEMFPCPEEGGGGTPSDPINPPPPNDNTGGSDNNQVVIIPTFNDSDFFDFDNQCKANFFISPSVTSDMRNWLNHYNNIFFKNKIYEMVEDQSSCEENHTEALAIWNFLYNNQTVSSSIIDFVLSGGDQNLAWNLVGLAVENNLEFNNNYEGNYYEFSNINDLNSFINYGNIENTSNLPNLTQNQILSTKDVKLSTFINLAIELMITPAPNFNLMTDQSTTFLMTYLPGNEWVQNSIFISNPSLPTNPNSAEITITGYINVGIKIGDYMSGIKIRKQIILRINKLTGVIYFSEVKTI
jgi:hypothetical protein